LTRGVKESGFERTKGGGQGVSKKKTIGLHQKKNLFHKDKGVPQERVQSLVRDGTEEVRPKRGPER